MSSSKKAPKNSKSSTMENNLKYFIINGIFFTLLINLFNPFAIKFLYRLGGNDFQVSLYNALPGLISLICILPGLYMINNTLNKQKLMTKIFFLSRCFFLFIILIPFLPIKLQPWIFLGLVVLRQFPESISVTALQGFTGDIFPSNFRATAISSKNRFSVLAQLSLSIILFFILLAIPEDANSIIRVYQIFFIFAFLFGMIEIFSFTKIKYTSVSPTKKQFSKFSITIFRDILTDVNFKRFVKCSLLFHFGWQMGWPLFQIYQVKYLGATEEWLIIFNVISSIVMFFSYKFWNKAINTKGNKLIMAVTTLGMSLTPTLYALSPNLYILAFANIITGFFTSGTITVLLNSLLEVCPEENRMLYVGTHATLTNITLFISPFIGNLIHQRYSIYIALFLCSFFRLIGSASFFARNKKSSI